MNLLDLGGTGRRQTLPSQSMSAVRLRNKDVLQQAQALPFWTQDYTQLSAGAFHGEIDSIATKGIQIFRESMTCSVDELACAPENSYVIGIAGKVMGDSHWGSVALTDKSLITLDKNAELVFRTSHQSEISVAVIGAHRLEEYAERIAGIDLRSAFGKLRPVEQLQTEHAESLRRMFNDFFVHLPPMARITPNHAAWRHFEDEIMAECLRALVSVKPLAQRTSDIRIHRYIVNRVRERTLSTPLCPPSIGELCLEINVSRRTLNHAFMRVLGITPVSYIRNIRLNRVRADLQTRKFSGDSIADVAVHWGFWHMSLFSRYYKGLFGELPSETRNRHA